MTLGKCLNWTVVCKPSLVKLPQTANNVDLGDTNIIGFQSWFLRMPNSSVPNSDIFLDTSVDGLFQNATHSVLKGSVL